MSPLSRRRPPAAGAPDVGVATAKKAAPNGQDTPFADGAPAAGGGTGGVGAVPLSARLLVVATLVALLVAGFARFEVWPLTGWRLFSLARDDTQSTMVVEAVDGEGASRVVSPEELPLGYRLAAWPMATLDGASDERRQEMCGALLDAVVDVEPQTVELRIVRDNQRLVRQAGEWTVTHDPEPPVASCAVSDTAGASTAGGADS